MKKNRISVTLSDSRSGHDVALDIFEAAIDAVHPAQLMPRFLYADDEHLYINHQQIDKKQVNQCIIIASGKAASAMAQAAETQIGGSITKGICITKYDHALPLQYISTIEAGHPVPDENSLLAGREVLKLVQNLTPNDIVLVLLSGGSSALLADVPEGCTLTEVQIVFDLLLKSGARIQEMNIVRKHLSAIKGGQLAKAAQPAKVFTLVLSDVVGDDLSTISSGPTVPDDSTFEEVYQILLQYNVWDKIPSSVQTLIQKGVAHHISDTPGTEATFFTNTHSRIIGNNRMALAAAAAHAEKLGYRALIKNDHVQQETTCFAKEIIETSEQYKSEAPVCILFGGETTVKVNGEGKGGRNQHLALLLLHEMTQHPDPEYQVTVLCGGSDGTDGNTAVAGAVITSSDTADPALIASSLSDFNSYGYFKQMGGHIYTGATQTNVMDIMLVIIE
jgi:glycerate 2-kinase